MDGLKCIIAGSRTILDYDLVKSAIEESGFEISEIVSGKAKGVDSLGERYAKETNIPIKEFPAQWDDLTVENCKIGINSFGKRYNKLAGLNRNREQSEYADALVAITNGSSGTADMIKVAKLNNLKIYVKNVDKI